MKNELKLYFLLNDQNKLFLNNYEIFRNTLKSYELFWNHWNVDPYYYPDWCTFTPIDGKKKIKHEMILLINKTLQQQWNKQDCTTRIPYRVSGLQL